MTVLSYSSLSTKYATSFRKIRLICNAIINKIGRDLNTSEYSHSANNDFFRASSLLQKIMPIEMHLKRENGAKVVSCNDLKIIRSYLMSQQSDVNNSDTK